MTHAARLLQEADGEGLDDWSAARKADKLGPCFDVVRENQKIPIIVINAQNQRGSSSFSFSSERAL